MLSVTVVQAASGLDPADNRAQLHDLVPSDSDLVVLPEAFARDFGEAGSDVSPYAEALDGAFATELAAVAAEHNTTVVAGMFTPGSGGRVRNTLLATGRGVEAAYDKIHLFDAFGFRESRTVAPGAEPVTIEVDGVTVGLTTCYDVRFPGLYQALADRGASVIALDIGAAVPLLIYCVMAPS